MLAGTRYHIEEEVATGGAAEEEQDCVTEGAGMSLASGGMW